MAKKSRAAGFKIEETSIFENIVEPGKKKLFQIDFEAVPNFRSFKFSIISTCHTTRKKNEANRLRSAKFKRFEVSIIFHRVREYYRSPL